MRIPSDEEQVLSMHKVNLFIASLCLLLGTPFLVHAEEIVSFTSEIRIAEDGSFTVTESIAYDFAAEDRHGIYRDIPTEHPQDASAWYKERYIDIVVSDVIMDGESIPHEVDRGSDTLSLKIGDPDATISGRHTYEITYTVTGALSKTGEVLELYWNVTGNEWDVPIQRAEARVYAAPSALGAERSCYVGSIGSQKSCGSITASTTPISFVARNLDPGEGLTIAQSLNTDTIAYTPQERTLPLIPIGVLLLGWFGVLGTLVYRYRTKYKRGETVIAQYEPFADFRPLFTGVLFDGRLDPRDVTAGLVQLAEEGFIKIKKTEQKILVFTSDDYEITLRRPIDEADTKTAKRLLKLLFDTNDAVGTTVALSELKSNQTIQRANQKILRQLKNTARDDLKDRGFFEQGEFKKGILLLLVPLIGFPLVLLGIFSVPMGIFALVFFVTIGATIGMLFFAIRRRTEKGYRARTHLAGFKQFLSVTEKERYKFHNAPEKSPEQFMEFLPYAIAFGVEKEWADVFADITIPNPDWYEGGSVHTFHAAAFASDMNGLSSAFSQSTGSASSGGGVSGGGAGGGGGGSW